MAMYRKNNESVFGVEEMVTGRFKAKSIEESAVNRTPTLTLGITSCISRRAISGNIIDLATSNQCLLNANIDIIVLTHWSGRNTSRYSVRNHFDSRGDAHLRWQTST